MSDEFHHKIGIKICKKYMQTLVVTRIFFMCAYGALLPAGVFANSNADLAAGLSRLWGNS